MSDKNYEYLYHFCSTDRQREYVDAYRKAEGNITKAAEILDIDRRAVGRGIKAIQQRAHAAGYQGLEYEPSVLIFDIETAPIAGWVWSLWQDNLIGGHKHLIQDTSVICAAAKWRGSDEVLFQSVQESSEKELLEWLWDLLDKADWTITHNGDNFDIKRLNARMVGYGMKPYRPIKSIDTLKMAKRTFKFTSNRLDALGHELLGERKVETGGFQLWLDCLEGDQEAWDLMRQYNEQDVLLLERVYEKLAAWDRLHPSYGLFSPADGVMRCPSCGSDNIKENGTVKTTACEYILYTCQDCGHHARGRQNQRKTKDLLAHAR